MGGGVLNRYEAFIREKRLFHLICNNINKTNKLDSLLARGVRWKIKIVSKRL